MELPSLNIEWKQEGNKVYFNFKDREIYFMMPNGFKLEETHKDLLKLSEWLMFSPWYDVIGDYKFSRKKGKNMGLSFSTGVDSTAVAVLFPEAKLVYTERDGLSDCVLKQDNALNMIENMEREVIRVKTNFEIIRTTEGLQVGYSTAIGMGVPIILLADYLDLGLLSYGKVMDDQFFPKGVYRGYTKDYYDRQGLIESCGLIGFYPTVGCSEVITTDIVNKSEYSTLSFSCLRGSSGSQCNLCYKCFRKNLLKGKKVLLDSQSRYAISKNPPKMATSLLYGLYKRNIDLNILQLDYLKDTNVDMLIKIHSEAYDIYPIELKELAIDRLKSKGYQLMSKEEEEDLKKLNFCREGELSPKLPEP